MELVKMARPTKWRKIESLPSVRNFLPSDEDISNQPVNILKVEELEAVRLKDLEGLEQTQCAENMGVSRPTFQRILSSAREKIADSLINGKAIRIDGGNFTRNICTVKCLGCGREWPESYENLKNGKNEYACPNCHSREIVCEQGEEDADFCRKYCCKRDEKCCRKNEESPKI